MSWPIWNRVCISQTRFDKTPVRLLDNPVQLVHTLIMCKMLIIDTASKRTIFRTNDHI